VTGLPKALRDSGRQTMDCLGSSHVVPQQDNATVLWKHFLRVGACTCDIMLYSACAGNVGQQCGTKQSSDCATVGDHFLQQVFIARCWVIMTWYMMRQWNICRKGLFSESAWSARRQCQSTDQAESSQSECNRGV
jgi:hypothetical protein